MQPFAYSRPEGLEAALAAATPECAFVAGATDFLPLWKAGIASPHRVIDISRLPLAGIEGSGGQLRIGALARMGDVADNPLVRSDWPVLASALLASASPQVRNAATVGGNLMQRTRCVYFRGIELPCNKARPGSGCGAIGGENRLHAIFGGSERCVATHASDLAVALVALDAQIGLRSRGGDRQMRLEEFYRLPGDTPERETALRPGEMILAVTIPEAAPRSAYLKVRDRASFEFAVVSVAAVLDIDGGAIRAARLAAGGVGTRPWRLRAAEQALVGRPPGAAVFAEAAELATAGAEPLSRNGFKLPLLQRTVMRALVLLGERA